MSGRLNNKIRVQSDPSVRLFGELYVGTRLLSNQKDNIMIPYIRAKCNR